jgi:hypothetical protein
MRQFLSILWEILSNLWEICYLIGIFRNHSSPPPSTTILESFSGKFFLKTRAQSEKVGQISFRPPPPIFSFPYAYAIILPPIGLSDHSGILLQPTGKLAPTLPTTRFKKRDCRASNKRRLTQSLENFYWTPILRLNSCMRASTRNFPDRNS